MKTTPNTEDDVILSLEAKVTQSLLSYYDRTHRRPLPSDIGHELGTLSGGFGGLYDYEGMLDAVSRVRKGVDAGLRARGVLVWQPGHDASVDGNTDYAILPGDRQAGVDAVQAYISGADHCTSYDGDVVEIDVSVPHCGCAHDCCGCLCRMDFRVIEQHDGYVRVERRSYVNV